MQVREIMTRDVVTVGPDTSTKYAAELMVERGFAALPVIDTEDLLVGIVAEADVLRDRLPPDPRLHMRRAPDSVSTPPPRLVRGVMTADVRSVTALADIADVARLLVDERLRSLPVVDNGRLVGIVSRRDLLRTLVRSDEVISRDLLQLIEGYTGAPDSWNVTVFEGVATIQRTRGEPAGSPAIEERAMRALARTVGGVVAAQVQQSEDD